MLRTAGEAESTAGHGGRRTGLSWKTSLHGARLGKQACSRPVGEARTPSLGET